MDVERQDDEQQLSPAEVEEDENDRRDSIWGTGVFSAYELKMVTKSKRRKLFPNFIIKKNSGLIMDQQGTNGTVQRVQEQNRRYVGQSTSAAASSGALAPLAKIEIGKISE